MIKFIGCMIIVLSSTGLGYMFGIRFKMRVGELRALKTSLQMLETEIVYSNTPLPDAFDIISRKSSSPIREIFLSLGKGLRKRTFETVSDAFDSALKDIKDRLSLVAEDLDILKSFGRSLGSSDVEGQVKSFKLVMKQLDDQEVKAEEARCRNERMYKNLGFLGGLAVAILLF